MPAFFMQARQKAILAVFSSDSIDCLDIDEFERCLRELDAAASS